MKLKWCPWFGDKAVYAQGNGGELPFSAADIQNSFFYVLDQIHHLIQVSLRLCRQADHVVKFQIPDSFLRQNFCSGQYIIFVYPFVDDTPQTFGAPIRCNGSSFELASTKQFYKRGIKYISAQ